MTKRENVNKQRFMEAAGKHFTRAFLRDKRASGEASGEILYAALNAAVGKLSVAQADKARKSFLQALRRRAK